MSEMHLLVLPSISALSSSFGVAAIMDMKQSGRGVTERGILGVSRVGRS